MRRSRRRPATSSRGCGKVAHVRDVESPLARANAGQLSRDGRSALVTFKLAGDDDAAADRVDATLAATAAAQRAHPDLRIEQFGSASAGKALGDVLADDFAKAERVSLPITLLILPVAFGALVAAGLPLRGVGVAHRASNMSEPPPPRPPVGVRARSPARSRFP
jgi:uncharacterized membrane protein YdfJ with MMPL/SSD domain